MTFSLMYAFSENFVLPLSHDEVVHGKGSLLGKMPGDDWKQFAGLRALLAYMWAHPGKQLLFMGSEFGQGGEWSAERGLDWWSCSTTPATPGVQRLVARPEPAYRDAPALWAQDSPPAGFSWIDANDAAGNVLSFLRLADGRHGGRVLACVANFAGGPHPTTGSGCRAPALARGGQHRRRRSTAAAAWATWARSRPWPSRGTASPPRPCSPCRRSACSGWRRRTCRCPGAEFGDDEGEDGAG